MSKVPKKVAAVHDIAGFGRSSLTVVLPTLSVMGHQACPAPTAVLSSITGYYTDYAMADMTDFLGRLFGHWKKEGCVFDCVYSGFIGSVRGVEITEAFIADAHAPLVVVDPVFADDGAWYDCFSADITVAMKKLITKADIITPNLTEACFLTDTPNTGDIRAAYRAAKALTAITNASILITGIPCGNAVAVLLYDRASDRFFRIDNPFVHVHYPGTGDLFTSVLTGALLSGKSLTESAGKAADFVFTAIRTAQEEGVPQREGVPMELMVPRLLADYSLPVIAVTPFF